MSLNIWIGLNVGMEFDEDDDGRSLRFMMDHDEVKGELAIEFKDLLEESLNESFDTAENVESIEEVTIPEFEGIKDYLLESIQMIDEKIIEAKGFLEENS